MRRLWQPRAPAYSKLPPAYDVEPVDAVEQATSAMAKLDGKELVGENLKGVLVLTFEAQLAVREAEGALVTAGLLAPSSMMRTRFIAEIVRLCCAGMRMDDPKLVHLWRFA